MSNTYTPNIGIAEPATNDSGWGSVLNSNFTLLDALTPVGGLGVQQAEYPSASLNVKVAAGVFRKSDGTLVGYAGTASQAVTASLTNYLYLSDAGALVVNTTGFPASTFHVRLAIVVAGTSTVTSVADARVAFVSSGASGSTIYLALAGGTFSDGAGVVTVGCGATNGTKVGATGDKLAFFGAAPVVQPANTVELVALLGSLGLRATGGNPALNLGTGALTCGAANVGGTLTLSDAQNVAVGTTTGTQVGTSGTQKLGFWGVTPVVWPAGANQAAITDSTGGTASFTLSDVTATPTQTLVNNNFATLARQLAAIRAALVAAGLIKGSA